MERMQPITTRSAGDDPSPSKGSDFSGNASACVNLLLPGNFCVAGTLSLNTASMRFCQETRDSESCGSCGLAPDVFVRLPSKLNSAIKKHLFLHVRDRTTVQGTSAASGSRKRRRPGPSAQATPPVTSADQRRVNLPSGEPTGDWRGGSLCWNTHHPV